jgi:general secretion pathway protein G
MPARQIGGLYQTRLRPLRSDVADVSPSSNPTIQPRIRGFTLIEILLVAVIVGVLAAMALPELNRALELGRIAAATGDINAMEAEILDFEAGNYRMPTSLGEIGRGGRLDPWGNPYQYLPIRGAGASKGEMRKDRFLVPINSDFDLYSMGRDGKTASALTAGVSKDDVIRANDGGYIGVAEKY